MKNVHVLLVSVKTVSCTCTRLSVRIILREVAVVVRTEVKLNELSELTDCSRHVAIEAIAAEVDHSHTAVCMERNAWLVTPKIRILVEVPV